MTYKSCFAGCRLCLSTTLVFMSFSCLESNRHDEAIVPGYVVLATVMLTLEMFASSNVLFS